MLRAFGHLMNQYSAAYYGYLWAEVLSADMFAQRFAKDCYDKEAGMAYRKQVLAPGGIGNINDHLAKFLGTVLRTSTRAVAINPHHHLRRLTYLSLALGYWLAAWVHL